MRFVMDVKYLRRCEKAKSKIKTNGFEYRKIPKISPGAYILYALPVSVYQQTDFRHAETGGRFAFTWYRCEISYRSEILAPVQEPG